MKREIVLRIAVPERLPRWVLWSAGILALVIGAGSVYATIKSDFKKGDAVSADAINANFKEVESRLVLPGTIVAYAGTYDPTKPPNGWRLCNGDAVSRTEFAALFQTIGISHGGGDGVATFNLPDLRGRFVRGVDLASGHDPDAAARIQATEAGSAGDAVGSLQGDQFQGHAHAYSRTNFIQLGAASNQNYDVQNPAYSTVNTGTPVESGYGAPKFGTETRPTNIALHFLIKI